MLETTENGLVRVLSNPAYPGSPNQSALRNEMSKWPPDLKVVRMAEMAHQHYDEMQRNSVTSVPVAERLSIG